MGDPLMEIGERELEKIGNYVKSHLAEWSGGNIIDYRTSREVELVERIVRVEEGLKNVTELMRQGFEIMEKRFEQIDKRFEQVDKRFEILEKHMDKRFSQTQWTMGLGFTLVAALMGIFNFF